MKGGRTSPVNSSAYRPIVLHHFTGRPGLRVFGHIALQVGNRYYTYGPGESKQISPVQDLKEGISTDQIRYGGTHDELVIPEGMYLSDNEIKEGINKFEANWGPKQYSFLK